MMNTLIHAHIFNIIIAGVLLYCLINSSQKYDGFWWLGVAFCAANLMTLFI